MTEHLSAPIKAEALDWIVRLQDADFDDWEAFDLWLAANPAHADAYHAMAIADQDMADLLATPVSQPVITPVPERRFAVGRRGWIGGALAASIAVVAGYSWLIPSSTYVVETPAGVRRTVTMADGSRIEMNGGTRLTMDRDRQRYAMLDRGEAVFTVIHDDARPFRVDVGPATLLDAGTVFNVTRDAGITSVAVAEGAVIYNPDQEAVSLPAGRKLRAADGEDELTVGDTDPGTVASWREGRLIYDGAPLSLVAADLTRNLGVTVTAAPDVAARTFRGVIGFDGDQDRVMSRIGPLLDVGTRRVQQGWILTAKTQ